MQQRIPPQDRTEDVIAQTTTKTINNNHAHLSISSSCMCIGPWTFILSLSFPKLPKIDYRHMLSVDLDLYDGYNAQKCVNYMKLIRYDQGLTLW